MTDKIDRSQLRDTLAVHRTTLANERTLLAYVRTAFTLFIAGVTFIKFFEHPAMTVTGWVLIPVSALIMIKGVVSFRKLGSLIVREEREARHIG